MSDDIRFRGLVGSLEEGPAADRLAQLVRVCVPGTTVPWARQLTVLALVDFLGRLAPNIQIECDNAALAHPLLPPGEQTLAERLQAVRRHALIEPGEAMAEPMLTVAVGPEAEADLYVDGDAWLSYLGSAPGELAATDETNPIGPLAAACRGASQVIQRLLGDLLPTTSTVEASYWSALNLQPAEGSDTLSQPLNDPTIHALLMGGGSIGGATIYALARVPGLRGSLAMCDPQRLEELNSRKALLARRVAIEAKELKIDVAKSELAHLADLVVDLWEGDLATYVAAGPRERALPLVACAVDSVPARRELADHMPLEALNAACGATHFVVSGHRTDDGPCVYCLYIGRVLDTDATRAKLIWKETGLPPGFINQWRVLNQRLDRQTLRKIALNRNRPPDALAHREGLTLDELFEAEFLYGEVELREQGEGRRTLQLPFVPALAGIILAGELLKAGDGTFAPYRLGPRGELGGEYEESVLEAPVGMLSRPRRWPDNACLCHSLRRLALMRQRYRLDD